LFPTLIKVCFKWKHFENIYCLHQTVQLNDTFIAVGEKLLTDLIQM